MNLLKMSFSSSVLIMVIVLLRKFFLNRLPKRAFLILWGIALFRLLAPVSIPSSFSIYTLFQREGDGRQDAVLQNQRIWADMDAGLEFGGGTAPPVSIPEAAEKNGMAGIVVSEGTASAKPPAFSREIFLRSFWIFGAFALAVFFATSYIRCCREFRVSFPVKNDFIKGWLADHRLARPVSIRTSDTVSTPLTYGIFRPVILMPENTDWREEKKLSHVLELSCDEAAVQRLGVEQRAAYARTLISMEERRAVPATLFSAFGRNAANRMEERITAVMKTKKTHLITIFMTMLLVAAVTIVFATSARAAAEPEEGTASEAGETDWEKEFTRKETEMLLALQFEGYETMTVSEFREKSQIMTDTKEYLSVIERFSELQEKISAARQEDMPVWMQSFADYFYNVYEPLNAEKWQTREFGDYVQRDFSTGENENYPVVSLEYFLSMTILFPDDLTVGQYCDVRQGVREDLEDFWREQDVEELTDEAFMKATIESRIKEITERRESQNLKLSIDYFYNPIDLQNAGDNINANSGTDSGEVYKENKRDPRRWPVGTRQDYDSLFSLMNRDGISYGERSVEDFNGLLLDWANEDYERTERIGEDAASEDYEVFLSRQERRFVELTMRLSGGENAQLVRSLYREEPEQDPWWEGGSLYKDCLDGAAFCTLYYRYPYHIPDKSMITVSERDERMERMERSVFEFFRGLEFEELLAMEKQDMVKQLELLAKALSDEKLTIYIVEDQIGFEHVEPEEYKILLNDTDASGVTVDAVLPN